MSARHKTSRNERDGLGFSEMQRLVHRRAQSRQVGRLRRALGSGQVGVRSPARRPTAEAPPSDSRSPALRQPKPRPPTAEAPPAVLRQKPRPPTAEAPPSDSRSPAVRRRPCPVGLRALCPPALLLLLSTGFLLPLLGWDGRDSERAHSRLQRTFSASGVLG